jgi:hypothetical protein
VSAVSFGALAGPGALAHGGHGDERWLGSMWHYVLEPAHLPLVVLLCALVAGGAFALLRSTRARRG